MTVLNPKYPRLSFLFWYNIFDHSLVRVLGKWPHGVASTTSLCSDNSHPDLSQIKKNPGSIICLTNLEMLSILLYNLCKFCCLY